MFTFLLIFFFIWRIGLFVVANLGSNLLPFSPRFPYSEIFLTSSRLPQWFWSFANFDGVHYLTIAKSGYWAQFTQVFFPLYPLLIRSVGSFIPTVSPIIIGLILSNFFFILTIIYFWKLLIFDYKLHSIRWIILFLISFPTSFFFGSLYTESLFLFFVILSFYAARKRKWWLAGILGGLSSATRFVGILLLPALLWEWQEEKFKVGALWASSKFKVVNQSSKLYKYYLIILHSTFYILHSPILYLVPLGLLSYMLYLQLKFGDFLYFWHAQPVFGAERSGGSLILLPQVVWRYLKIIFTVPPSSYYFWVAFWEFVSLFVGLGLLFIGLRKRIRISYLIFSFLVVIVPTLTGTLSSMPRYILSAFPIFIVLGLIQKEGFKILLLVLFFLFLIIFTIFFTSGNWVA